MMTASIMGRFPGELLSIAMFKNEEGQAFEVRSFFKDKEKGEIILFIGASLNA